MAEDVLSDVQIAKRVGVSQPCLYKWRDRPEFQERMDQCVAAYRKRIRNSSIAVIENCVARIARDIELLDQVEAARARVYGAEQFKNAIPGGDTGKVTITRYRLVTDPATGKKQNVPIVAVDTQTELVKLAMLKQAQQHLGQWQEKTEGAGGDRLSELIEIAKRGAVGPEEPAKPVASLPADLPPEEQPK